MHSHLVVFLAEEKDVVAEHESNHLVEFEHCVETTQKESTERIEFVKVFNYDFIVFKADCMIGFQHRQEIIKPQVFPAAGRLAEFLVYLLYDVVCNHDSKRMKRLYFMVGGEMLDRSD